ncbi:MAG TPA: hypothetical protein VEX88_11150 [Glaciibacter sp.]|nr:hypothetical protein [Glaciibacter sp.]
MMRIHYAGGSALTGTAIARAVVELAEQLALSGTAATLDIPMRQDDGTRGSAQLLLGPASQIVAETVETDLEEIQDGELVQEIKRRALALKSHPGLPTEPGDNIGWDPDTEVKDDGQV